MNFRLGINYWPADKAMYWWRLFDPQPVRSDFARLRQAGFDSVRIFLLWEDFQPEPGRVSEAALRNLKEVADAAASNQLSLIVTLFTGHMSGVNWLPDWALASGSGAGRFRVFSNGRIVNRTPRNWYADSEIRRAQVLLARTVAQTLGNHPALWAYDLGNENSNCVVPPSRTSALEWLDAVAGAIRAVDPAHEITLGLHAEDLEEDRNLGPSEAGRVCDFLSMHGYPLYLPWTASIDDVLVLPFLGLITRWLGGRDVLFEEFGVPAGSAGSLAVDSDPHAVPVLDETRAADFTARALRCFLEAGLPGAMLWCFADYHSSLWSEPPLDGAPHERHFGLWRRDLSPKPALAEVERFAGQPRRQPPADSAWIDIAPEDFYRAPGVNLRRMYRRYCQMHQREGIACPV
jgi:endo-1,4-beta-mannosidase